MGKHGEIHVVKEKKQGEISMLPDEWKPRQVFEPVVLEDGAFITADIWPDNMGFVMLRNPMGEVTRGFGFRGEDKAYEYVAQILEEREGDLQT